MRTFPAAALPAPLLAFAAACALTPACTCTDVAPAAPPMTAPFVDDFDRAEIGPDWNVTDPSVYKIENGELVVRMGHNHPMWLKRALPANARIELDCWSNDDAGDLKVEIWGDGRSFATDLVGQYTSSAYNFIFGGWHNQLSTLARLNEHGEDRKVRTQPKVEKGRRYHFTITRQGGHIDWQIDGQPFLAFDDPAPLTGPDHSYFAINNWEAELHFDHLKITPL